MKQSSLLSRISSYSLKEQVLTGHMVYTEFLGTELLVLNRLKTLVKKLETQTQTCIEFCTVVQSGKEGSVTL